MSETAAYAVFKTSSGAQIHRIPLQAFPKFWAYVYVIRMDGANILIDSGSGTEVSHEDLLKGLRQAGLQPSDLTHILLTHAHIDHYGGLSKLKPLTRAKIGCHELDLQTVSQHEARLALIGRRLASFLAETGLAEETRDSLLGIYRLAKSLYRSVTVDLAYESQNMQVGPLEMIHLEEQQMLMDAVGKYAENDLRPAAHDAEESRELPKKLVSKGWELGLLQASIPEAYGGFGERSAVTGVLAVEEMAFGDLAGALAVMTPSLFATPILLAGSEEQKQEYLPKIIEGDWAPYTAALIEYSFDFDPNALKTNCKNERRRLCHQRRESLCPVCKRRRSHDRVRKSRWSHTRLHRQERRRLGLSIRTNAKN
jgi:hypothetical protein